MEETPPSINGWTPPVVQDDYSGRSRIATQQDFDELTMIANAYRALRKKLLDAEQDHKTLQAQITERRQ
ncbi:MAG TPA: hypothetical protein VNH21_14655 [Steroidobacteraceae bacterium]|nr:hypothetical protein [Steroidobacteraceae bacterium]